jgi:uncharacterized protein
MEASRLAASFGRALRSAGLDVPVSAVIGFAEAMSQVGLSDPGHVYWAGRCVFVRRPEDAPTYGRAFAAFFAGTPGLVPPPAALPQDPDPDPDPVQLIVEAPDEPDAEGAAEATRSAADRLVLRYSPAETFHRADFAALSPLELDEAYRLIAALRTTPPERPSRRRRPVAHGRGRFDLRRTVRRSLRTGGEPVALRRLARSARPRRLVLLLDVSGSMEPYARAFLRFAHSAVVAGKGIEAFTLGTRLTGITRELRWRDPDAALDRAAGAVADMAGGTRLGPTLRAFNDRYGSAGVARGAVVVILSDGWDRGDPDELAAEMARLGRLAYRIIWVNPLKATPGYAPLARGMAAALPYVDEFVEGHSLGALERLVVEVMGR